MTDVLAAFFGTIAVVSFVWAIRFSILAHRASRRARESLKRLIGDDSLPPEFKQLMLRLNMFSRWRPFAAPPAIKLDEWDERLWERAHADGLVTDEGLAAVREQMERREKLG